MKQWIQRSRSFLILTLWGMLCHIPAAYLSPVHAGQWQDNSLQAHQSRNFIGEHTYITEHTEGLTAKTIAARHFNNLRGKRNVGKVINLTPYNTDIWLAFSITNNAQTENWVLHFGDVTDGRFSMTRQILVTEYNTQTTYIDTYSAASEAQIKKGTLPLVNNAVPVTLEKGKELFILVRLKHEGPLPQTLTPSLMTYEHYIKTLNQDNVPSLIFKGMMLLLIGIIVALSIAEKSYAYMIFNGYIILQTLLFTLLQQNFHIPMGVIDDAALLTLIAAIFCKWVAAQIFYTKSAIDDKAMLALVANGAIIMLAYITGLFLKDQPQNVITALIYAPLLLSALIGTIFASIHNIASKRIDAAFLFLSWSALFIALSAAAALSFGLLPATHLNASLYWVCVLIQSILGVTAIFYKTRLDREEEDTRKAREKRAAASMARLQQAKETSDQARLLRVIERERELMAELREREMLRTEEMRKAKLAADEANRAKSAFLAVVSHEVRTPMNGIMGMIRLLRNTQMSKQQTDFLQSMQTSGDTMLALLNDILDFEKIESGKMELESIEFNMPKLVQDVVTLMTGHASEKNITLGANIQPDFPRTLLGDPTRLRQVILNLVSNAIKFTDQGSVTIILKAEKLPASSEGAKNNENGFDKFKITCAVKDTGIGISKEAQDSLFTPFTQADKSTSRKYGGTGLGLTICRRLIEAMSGKITLESTEGHGSTFTFTLHTTGTENAAAHTQGNIQQSLKTAAPMRILVVEDNEINRRVIKGFLEKDGHQILLRESGEGALDICGKESFDVIITDINLGGMSGLDFTKNLRLFPNKKIAATPVIALSGNVDQEDIRNCYAANMNGFLTKPIDPEALAAMLLRVETGEFEQKVILPEHNQTAPQTKEPEPKEEKEPQQEQEIAKETDDEIIILPAPPASFDTETPPPPPPPTPFVADDHYDSFEDLGSSENTYIPVPPPAEEMVLGTETPTQQPLQEPNQSAAENEFKTFDPDALEMIAGSLPTDQIKELLKSFTDKADEIIADLEKMSKTPDAQDLYAKSHELKGMAGNFGMTEMADISAAAEKAAKGEDIETTLSEIKKLPDANRRAQEELKIWLETF